MNDLLHTRFAYALTVCMMLAACGSSSSSDSDSDSSNKASRDDAIFERLPHRFYEPGMGDLMNTLQLRHAKLWHAGQAENWQLAAFELHEIEETFEQVARWHPQEEGLPIGTSIEAHMQIAAAALEQSIADRKGFELATGLLPHEVARQVLGDHVPLAVISGPTFAREVGAGGHVVIVVPAFNWAMSPADYATGHVRRYTKKSMRKAMEAAGLEIVKLHYANMFGLFGYVFTTKILRLMPGPGKLVLVYDRFVAPINRALEKIANPPFGQSVVAVARVGQKAQ